MTNWKQGELPPVGAECEYVLGNSQAWKKCNVLFIVGRQGVVIESKQAFEGVQFCSFVGLEAITFRPIRTDAEIEREETYRKLIELMPTGYSSTFNNGMSKAIKTLIEEGLLSDPEKRVKALSRHEALGYYHMSEALYNELLNYGRIQGVDNE